MPTIRQSIQILSIIPLFALSACGDGWETRPYNGTPYDGRTAGSGVEYVLAKMMPKKGLETAAPAPAPAEVKPAAPAPAPAEVKMAPAPAPEKEQPGLLDKMFSKKMGK